MMFAFWIGTLPLLSLLAIGSESLRNRNVLSKLASTPVLGVIFRVPLQAVVASLMIAFGVYTIAYRSQISLEGMISPIHAGELNQSNIAALSDEPLPCCKERLDKNQNSEPIALATGLDSPTKPKASPEASAYGSEDDDRLEADDRGR